MKIGLSLQGQFGNYRLGGLLGEGGFGCVFRADGPGATNVAVKFLHDLLDRDARTRMLREMKILKRIKHPNIVPLLDSGEDADGRPWYAMPEMPGGTLANWIGEKHSWEDVLRVIGGVGTGLSEYHARGGVHRDIKPENILLDDKGNPKLADFGLGRCPNLTGSAMTKTACGTPGYMAPEVYENEASQASDVYALGIVLWELVNGKRHRVPVRPPPELNVRSEFSDVDDLYRRMTHADAERRPTAKQVVEECDEFRKRFEPRTVRPDTSGQDSWLVALVVVGILAILSYLAYQLYQSWNRK